MAFTFNPFTGNFDFISIAPDVFDIQVHSADFTAEANKTNIVDTTSAITITLPPTTEPNTYVIVKDSTGNANTNEITVQTPASETIDGMASDIIDSDYESRTYIFNGTNWFIV